MNTNMANRRRNRASGPNPYVFVSYENSHNFGYVAVIDPAQNNTIINRIPVGLTPGPMCLNFLEDKLYVINTGQDTVTIVDAYTFKVITTVSIGDPSTINAPVAILCVEDVYVAHKRGVAIIDYTNKVIKDVQLPIGSGSPFALATAPLSDFVYVACKSDDSTKGNVFAISIRDNNAYSYGEGIDLEFDGSHNPLTANMHGQPQVTLGPTGMLTSFAIDEIYPSKTFSLLDNTVSGVYANEFLFCTSQEDKAYLKQFKDLQIDPQGNITYDQFTEIPSYKGQDKIRTSYFENYIGVTIKPTTSPRGGLQLYDVRAASSQFVPLSYVGDLAFGGDTMAYVTEVTSIRPIDVATATALPSILIGQNLTDRIIVKNIVSHYSYQSY